MAQILDRSPRWVLLACTLLLFNIWSNSFIAIAYLLGRDGAPQRFDWIGLTVARFLTAAVLCAVYCFGFRFRDSMALLRSHAPRLLACGALAVPAYNLALYYGQQHGVPAPVASLTTTLVPLFVMLLAAATLGERITTARVAGFAVAAVGMGIIASSRKQGLEVAYPTLIAVTALAPLSWSGYSVLSKEPMRHTSPVLWTYLSIIAGTALVLPLGSLGAWRQWRELDPAAWGALLYLAVPCTVLGFLIWTWLLRHLPAATVGFTVFLNPPLTTTWKYVLSVAAPATFAFAVLPREWIGGAFTLAGLTIAVRGRPGRGTPARRDLVDPGNGGS
jgi:drug/metabolite transporter (DMT)-like permease